MLMPPRMHGALRVLRSHSRMYAVAVAAGAWLSAIGCGYDVALQPTPTPAGSLNVRQIPGQPPANDAAAMLAQVTQSSLGSATLPPATAAPARDAALQAPVTAQMSAPAVVPARVATTDTTPARPTVGYAAPVMPTAAAPAASAAPATSVTAAGTPAPATTSAPGGMSANASPPTGASLRQVTRTPSPAPATPRPASPSPAATARPSAAPVATPHRHPPRRRDQLAPCRCT